jgi:probable F420-dependent oxidoreductase
MVESLHGTGIWSADLRYGDPSAVGDAAAELESVGYSALWIPDVGGEVFAAVEQLLAATVTATVATGILNLWMHQAEDVAVAHDRLSDTYGDRFLVGIGVSHQPIVEGSGVGTYTRPLAQMQAYLDQLDGSTPPLLSGDRVLAALRPKMLELARVRTAGAHPYLVTAEHTAEARQALGSGPWLAPEVGVVLESDPERARRIARGAIEHYMTLPNYTGNWLRLGFSPDDLTGGGSDRLVDALVAWGDDEAIARRVAEHRDAGADHVCIQVLTEDHGRLPLDEWRRLAPALIA